jgi:hypothetical protein
VTWGGRNTNLPFFLHGVATQTRHARETRLTIPSDREKRTVVQAALTSLAGFLRSLKGHCGAGD